MKDKKKIAFLSLALTALLALSGCGGNNPSTDPSKNTETTSADPGTSATESTETTTSEETTSEETTSEETTSEETTSEETTSEETTSEETTSEDPVVYHTVRFLLDGDVLKSYQVKEGETVTYDGEEPAKQPTAEICKFVFKGWDKDVKQPITADVDFNAVFREYVLEQEIDDFEKYEGNTDLADAGWVAQTYKDSGWTDQTSASVTMSTNATHGEKAVRLNAWDNGMDFKIVNHGLKEKFSKAANALKFSFMAPSFMATKVLVYTVPVEIQGQTKEPKFEYTLNRSKTGNYVDYTIPLASAGWRLWGEEGKSIAETASWLGIDVDDFPTYITKIEFYLKGNKTSNTDMIAFLDNVRFVTEENPGDLEESVTILYDRYTAVLNDGTTLRIDIDAEKNAVAKVIDIETPQEVPGKITYEGDNVVFTSADSGATLVYKGTMTNGGQLINFVSATGAFAPAVDKVKLNAVQVVDNYEGYASDGKAYYQGNTDLSQRSGARGAYYSEYYAGGTASSPYGGSGWSLLGGDGSQLKLKQDKAGAHSGNNYLCLKHSKSVAFRYILWGMFDGTAEKNAYRGSTFSFWAKTNGLVNQFTVLAYSKPQVTLQTETSSQVRYEKFEQTEAIGQWKHFEITLNPNLVYYGFMIKTDKNTNLSANESYLYIDDVEIYTANPYKAYIAPEPPVEQKELTNGQVFFTSVMGMASGKLIIKKDNACQFLIPAVHMNIFGTYSMVENEVTLDFDELGTIVATLDKDATNLTYVKATGELGAYGELDFGEVDVLDNAETYTDNGHMYYQGMTDKSKRDGARGAYFCDYYSGGSGSPVGGSGWSLMGGNGDQLSLETSGEFVYSGSNSIKMKRNKTNAMRYMTWGLMDGTADAHTGANYFVYYAKNPNSVALTIKTSVYYQAKVEPATQQSNRAYVEAAIPANSDWVQVVIPLDPAKTYYGVAYTAATVSGGSGADFFYIDDQMFVSEEMNILSPFVAINNLAMTGTTLAGETTITIGEGGKVSLTNAALGGTINATFTLIDSTMTIKLPAVNGGSGTTLVGTYGPADAEDTFQFVVTSCTGDLASYITADTVFSGLIPNA